MIGQLITSDRDGGGYYRNVIGELIALTVTEGRLAECDWSVDRSDRDGGGYYRNVIGELIALTVTEGETGRM